MTQSGIRGGIVFGPRIKAVAAVYVAVPTSAHLVLDHVKNSQLDPRLMPGVGGCVHVADPGVLL